MTLLEHNFPFDDVSRLVAADRRAPDPAYQAHRWWARRPPALLRAALVAATMPSDAAREDFRRTYSSSSRPLEGCLVLDPFVGGGTTLVEASRLGSATVGSDVDPIAVSINQHQLSSPAPEDVRNAGESLRAHLATQIGELWPSPPDAPTAWAPLHYFAIAKVACPSCNAEDHLYRSLIIARSIGKPGAVVRKDPVVAFCPDCLDLHYLEHDADSVDCCGQSRPLDRGTYARARFTCRTCHSKSTHEDLKTGAAERTVLAVEDVSTTPQRTQRRIRRPAATDIGAIETAELGETAAPDAGLTTSPQDRRPLSYGIERISHLHTARQATYLAAAFAWIRSAGLAPDVARAMELAVSTTITSNNKLCGYATDYGRLAPLFSVRAFSLPWLAVELNPLSAHGGRGTLRAAIERVASSCGSTVRRNVFHGQQIRAEELNLPRIAESTIVGADATTPPDPTADGALADLCITDPPYFDFIPYDTLSQVFRAWSLQAALHGNPVLPDDADPVETFGARLGAALQATVQRCKDDALIGFTYKGGDDAWDAVGEALDEAKLRVTALWPVLADPHMGHHSSAGNCEYDILIITRSIETTDSAPSPGPRVDQFVTSLAAHRPVSSADIANINAAENMASPRWGTRNAN